MVLIVQYLSEPLLDSHAVLVSVLLQAQLGRLFLVCTRGDITIQFRLLSLPVATVTYGLGNDLLLVLLVLLGLVKRGILHCDLWRVTRRKRRLLNSVVLLLESHLLALCCARNW